MPETLQLLDKAEAARELLLTRYPSLRLVWELAQELSQKESSWQSEIDPKGSQLTHITIPNLKETLKTIPKEPLTGGSHRKEIFVITDPKSKKAVVFKGAEKNIDPQEMYQRQKHNFDQGLPVTEPLAVVKDLSSGDNYLLEEKGSLFLDYLLEAYNKLRQTGQASFLSEAVYLLKEFVGKWQPKGLCPNELEPEKLVQHLLVVERGGKKSVVITDAFIDQITPERQKNLQSLQSNFIDYIKKNKLTDALSTEDKTFKESVDNLRHDIKTQLTALLLGMNTLLDKGINETVLDIIRKNQTNTFRELRNRLNDYTKLWITNNLSLKDQLPLLLKEQQSLVNLLEEKISAIDMNTQKEELKEIINYINTLTDGLNFEKS